MEIDIRETSMCFGCSQKNPIGLKLTFTMDGDVCRSTFTAGAHHQGWTGYVHGGIISSLLDEVMAQWVWLQNVPAMTAEMTVRFSKAVPIDVPLSLESRRTGGKGKLYIMEGQIVLPDGSVPCRATAKFLGLSEKDGIIK
ncbi:MAG: thioesterase [Peptococcaceae bacterium BICA1-7]|nr:MAG: thioesterase [Peptococcaceae bacterium BICA1-7]HBV98397.1 PaaI family thioesterase [Desulfotomaculum sp.]